MYSISTATAADMKDIHGLITELAVYEKAPDAVIISANDLERDFNAGLFEALVATEDATGKTVGMALYYPRYSTWKGPTLHLEDFYIQPAHRQNGLGMQIFDRVARIAAAKNVGRMEWTVLEWNTPALNFYQKIGADLDSEWHLGTLTREQLKAWK